MLLPVRLRQQGRRQSGEARRRVGLRCDKAAKIPLGGSVGLAIPLLVPLGWQDPSCRLCWAGKTLLGACDIAAKTLLGGSVKLARPLLGCCWGALGGSVGLAKPLLESVGRARPLLEPLLSWQDLPLSL